MDEVKEAMEEFRAMGHYLVDRLADYLETAEERPLSPAVEPRFLDELFRAPLPADPAPLAQVVRELEEKLLPYSTQLSHPGYFGLITSSPTPAGILADFIASALNQNLGAYTIGPAAVALERRSVRWLADLAGYDERAGGNLTSGGTMATFIGLKLARDHVSRDRAQHDGVTARYAAYASEERHVSVDKAADAIGIGRNGLRVLPTDELLRLDLAALEAAIAADRAAGVRPLCIVGMGGTTNTGAVDDLRTLRTIADREGMWLHVDAAYGGGMLVSERHRDVLAGISLADSITIDPHKWFFAPVDAGAILVRDASALTRSFGMQPSYLRDRLDPGGERYNYYVHGFEQSRRFRGLKVWMGFKRYGAREIGRCVDANVEQARHLHALAEAHPDFASAAWPRMSAVCIRYRPGGVDATGAGEARLARIHAVVARRVEASGRFWISTTALKGHTYFRINPVNFRTRRKHMDELFALLAAECARARQEEADQGGD